MNLHAKHLPADQRRAVTVDAVVKLAAEGNPSEITTAAIAREMGVTQGALFRHFPSKEAILEAVMEWVAERLLARVDAAAQAAASPMAAIESVFLAHVAFVVEHPGVPRMLFGELQRTEMTAPKRMAGTLLRGYRERVAQLMARGKAAGELPEALDADAAITLLVGMLQGLVMQAMLAGDVERIRRDAPRVFAIYRRGIGSTQ